MRAPHRRLTPVHYTALVRVFELDGFHVARRKGDHIVMTKPGIKRPVVIRQSARMVPVTHILTNMRTAGMTRKRFFDMLDRVS